MRHRPAERDPRRHRSRAAAAGIAVGHAAQCDDHAAHSRIAGHRDTADDRAGSRRTSALRGGDAAAGQRHARGLGGERMSLAPYTGWGREDFAALADRMLLAARRYASPSQALITLPGAPGGYGTAIDGLEGFARTFLLAGFRVAGEQGSDPLNLLERYAAGLAAGTDPASP